MGGEPLEAQEQKWLFDWAKLQSGAHPELKLMMHIPNGGYRIKAQAAKMSDEGVKPGVPDIFLPAARGEFHGLWIEMKRVKTGRLSCNQKGWVQALTDQGYRVEVCHGWVEAKDVIEEYLGM